MAIIRYTCSRCKKYVEEKMIEGFITCPRCRNPIGLREFNAKKDDYEITLFYKK